MPSLKSTVILAAIGILGLEGNALADPILAGAKYQVSDQNGNVFTPAPDGGLYTGVSFLLNGTTSVSASAGQFSMNYRTDGSAESWSSFLSFCLQPNVYLTPFDNPYTANTLSAVGYDLEKISELYGRYYGLVTNDVNAAAFQVALWELSYGDRNGLLNSGSFALSMPATSAVYGTAQYWLSQLDGSGPRDNRLLVLVNAHPTGSYDKQDLIVRVPEPAPLAMFGFALLALALVRRRRMNRSLPKPMS